MEETNIESTPLEAKPPVKFNWIAPVDHYDASVGIVDGRMPGSGAVKVFALDGTVVSCIARLILGERKAIVARMGNLVLVCEGNGFERRIPYDIVDVAGYRVTGLNYVHPSLPKEMLL